MKSALVPLVIGLLAGSQGILMLRQDAEVQGDQRIEKLEQRVERLEGLIFNAVSLSVFDAERTLAEARSQLENSEQLYIKGFITDAQVQHDRFIVERSRRELDLARCEHGGSKIASEIEVMQARRNLELAKQQLAHSERLNVKGYSSPKQLQALREQVQVRNRKLQQARDKLKAATDLLENK